MGFLSKTILNLNYYSSTANQVLKGKKSKPSTDDQSQEQPSGPLIADFKIENIQLKSEIPLPSVESFALSSILHDDLEYELNELLKSLVITSKNYRIDLSNLINKILNYQNDVIFESLKKVDDRVLLNQSRVKLLSSKVKKNKNQLFKGGASSGNNGDGNVSKLEDQLDDIVKLTGMSSDIIMGLTEDLKILENKVLTYDKEKLSDKESINRFQYPLLSKLMTSNNHEEGTDDENDNEGQPTPFEDHTEDVSIKGNISEAVNKSPKKQLELNDVSEFSTKGEATPGVNSRLLATSMHMLDINDNFRYFKPPSLDKNKTKVESRSSDNDTTLAQRTDNKNKDGQQNLKGEEVAARGEGQNCPFDESIFPSLNNLATFELKDTPPKGAGDSPRGIFENNDLGSKSFLRFDSFEGNVLAPNGANFYSSYSHYGDFSDDGQDDYNEGDGAKKFGSFEMELDGGGSIEDDRASNDETEENLKTKAGQKNSVLEDKGGPANTIEEAKVEDTGTEAIKEDDKQIQEEQKEQEEHQDEAEKKEDKPTERETALQPEMHPQGEGKKSESDESDRQEGKGFVSNSHGKTSSDNVDVPKAKESDEGNERAEHKGKNNEDQSAPIEEAPKKSLKKSEDNTLSPQEQADEIESLLDRRRFQKDAILKNNNESAKTSPFLNKLGVFNEEENSEFETIRKHNQQTPSIKSAEDAKVKGKLKKEGDGLRKPGENEDTNPFAVSFDKDDETDDYLGESPANAYSHQSSSHNGLLFNNLTLPRNRTLKNKFSASSIITGFSSPSITTTTTVSAVAGTNPPAVSDTVSSTSPVVARPVISHYNSNTADTFLHDIQLKDDQRKRSISGSSSNVQSGITRNDNSVDKDNETALSKTGGSKKGSERRKVKSAGSSTSEYLFRVPSKSSHTISIIGDYNEFITTSHENDNN